MFDHLTLTVSNLSASTSFYTGALAPLGYTKQRDYGVILGFGPSGKPQFWIKQGPAPQSSMHLAFQAKDRGSVDRFYAAALDAGARDDGAPGLRHQYHPHYYGAFVIDPDGHHLEAVCHHPLPEVTVAGRVKAPPAKAKKKKAAPAKKSKKR